MLTNSFSQVLLKVCFKNCLQIFDKLCFELLLSTKLAQKDILQRTFNSVKTFASVLPCSLPNCVTSQSETKNLLTLGGLG